MRGAWYVPTSTIAREVVTVNSSMLARVPGPAEREAIIAQFVQAALDDVTHGVVTFGEGKTQSRIELLKAQFTARPKHGLTAEVIDPKLQLQIVPAAFGSDGQAVEMSAITPTADGKAISAERKAYLLKTAGIPEKKQA